MLVFVNVSFSKKSQRGGEGGGGQTLKNQRSQRVKVDLYQPLG